jgi:hypothetical protein
MDELARRERIRTRLRHGELPWQSPNRVWAGYGKGELCDACAERIQLGDVAYELGFPAACAWVSLHFHQRCSDWWNLERRTEDSQLPPLAPVSATQARHAL